MPLYPYECGVCGYEFEKLAKTPPDDCACPEYGGQKSNRLIGLPSPPVMGRRVRVPKEVDRVVGADAEQKWQKYQKRWEDRKKGVDTVSVAGSQRDLPN